MTKKEQTLKLFENTRIRTHWDAEQEKWYFSVVDVVGVLTDSLKPNNYWKVLKHRLAKEGSELVTKCNQLKMKSSDGKYYATDVADTENLLRLIQSIPSPKAEPFKLWLAKVGSDRLDEISDPELSIDRAMETYRKKGYSEKWINQRIKTIEARKELTDEWNRSGIEEQKDFAILTNEITRAWSGLTVQEYKQLKELKKESLRDHMTNTELVLNMLAEVATTEISKAENPSGIDESRSVAKRGGGVAKKAREELESQTGKKVVTGQNAKRLQKSDKKLVE